MWLCCLCMAQISKSQSTITERVQLMMDDKSRFNRGEVRLGIIPHNNKKKLMKAEIRGSDSNPKHMEN